MYKTKNIIKKFAVEVDTYSMNFGLQLKDDISGFLQQYIYRKLEVYFEDSIPEDEIWRFDKIDIEIDLDSSESIKDISPIIITKLDRIVSKNKAQSEPTKLVNYKKSTTTQNQIEAFFEFLKTGSYPWWYEDNKIINFTDFKTTHISQFKAKFKSVDMSSVTLNRLFYQFNNQFITKIYILLHSKAKTVKSGKLKPVPMLSLKTTKLLFWQSLFLGKKAGIIHAFETIIAKMSTAQNVGENTFYTLEKDKEKGLFELLQFCNKMLRVGLVLTAKSNTKNILKIDVISDSNDAFRTNKKRFERRSDPQQEKEEKKLFIFQFSEVFSEEKTGRKPEQFDDKIEVKNEADLLEIDTIKMAEEDMLIGNGGLVLLHPFLKHFFINLELLSENMIIPEKQDLAVHLLHYTATKNVQPSEHDLFFEKYLCNIPTNQPVDRFVQLTERQKNSCDELLQAVLKHWTDLRTNSIDALRSEFLMRDGKLTIDGDTHRLYIQRKTQDILLDTLPWNLHMVKLPWTEQMLYVEW